MVHEPTDLKLYWSAFQIFFQNGNPYSSEEMRNFLNLTAGEHFSMVWNPPVFFIIMLPILVLPFQAASYLWLFLSLAFAFFGGYLFARLLKAEMTLFQVIGTLCCFPLFIDLKLGQLTIFLTFVFCLSALAIKNKRDFLAGICLTILSIKPHIFFIYFLYLAFLMFRDRRWKIFFGGLSSYLILGVFAELIRAGVWSFWLQRERWPMEYIGSTWSSLARVIHFENYHFVSSLPMILLPLVGVVIFSLLFLRSKGDAFCFFLVSSLLLATIFGPYGFIMDQSVLMLAQAYLVVYGISDKLDKRIACYLIILLNLLIVFVTPFHFFGLKPSWFLLPIVLAIFLYASRKRELRLND